jgi:hypothetical protein
MRRTLLSLLTALVTLPGGWPHHLALGLTDSPGDARQLAEQAPLDLRYQYLAGGVNTGSGWATWNPDGTFASMYVQESIAAHMIPVLTYYQLLQSRPAPGADELQKDISNLRDPATMRAYWSDFALLLRRVAGAAGRQLVVIHVEPDLWGYLEQARATALARSFARHLLALRDRLAPHVLLAWHLSVWGTGEDPTYSKPSLAHMDALAARSAAFYRSLHARFDVVFNDVTDRDADFYKVIEGNPYTWWGPADFARHDRYIAGFTRRTHTARRAVAAPARQHVPGRHVGSVPGRPRPVVAGGSHGGAPARNRGGRGDRAAVRRRRVGDDQRAERRRAVLPAGPPV